MKKFSAYWYSFKRENYIQHQHHFVRKRNIQFEVEKTKMYSVNWGWIIFSFYQFILKNKEKKNCYSNACIFPKFISWMPIKKFASLSSTFRSEILGLFLFFILSLSRVAAKGCRKSEIKKKTAATERLLTFFYFCSCGRHGSSSCCYLMLHLVAVYNVANDATMTVTG